MTLGEIARNLMTFFRTLFLADDIRLSYANPKWGALCILVNCNPIIIRGGINFDPGYFIARNQIEKKLFI